MSGKREYLDLALLRYDLKVDMSDSFHWNVKMIFLYLVAEYHNEKNVVNQVRILHEILYHTLCPPIKYLFSFMDPRVC